MLRHCRQKNGAQPNFTNMVRRQYAIRHFTSQI